MENLLVIFTKQKYLYCKYIEKNYNIQLAIELNYD